MAGLKVPGKSFIGAAAFLDKVELKDREENGYKGGIFTYHPGNLKNATKKRTAIGMTSRLFLGTKPDELRAGAEWLLAKPPEWRIKDFYLWYYGTLAMFQMGGDYWKEWNPKMRDMLIANQRKGGDEDGSWDPNPKGKYKDFCCRVMSTALGALCLEVYYRYLPMNQ